MQIHKNICKNVEKYMKKCYKSWRPNKRQSSPYPHDPPGGALAEGALAEEAFAEGARTEGLLRTVIHE